MTETMANRDTTEDLVRRAREGNREAFAVLFERFRDRLEHQIDARMGADARRQLEPADVLQETFARAYESLGALAWRGDEPFYRWLAAIAEHFIKNASRKRMWERLRLEDIGRTATPPSRQLRREERFERLEHALSSLSADHRRVLILFRIDGLSQKAIAAKMGRSPGAIQKLLARAVLELRNSFGDTESLHLPPRALGQEDEVDGV